MNFSSEFVFATMWCVCDCVSLDKKCVCISVAWLFLKETATRLSLRLLPHQVMPCCIFLVMLLIIWLDLISLTSKIFKSNICSFIQNTIYFVLTIIMTNILRTYGVTGIAVSSLNVFSHLKFFFKLSEIWAPFFYLFYNWRN